MSRIYGRVDRTSIKGTVYGETCCLPSYCVPQKLKKPPEKMAQNTRRCILTPASHLARVNAPGILTIISTDSHYYEHLRGDKSSA